MNLSKSFTLAETLESGTARRMKIAEQFNPPQIIVDNLTALCIHILQPLRDELGPLHISSGYRCPALNKAVGGAKNSQHVNGEAADVQGSGRISNKMIYETILDLKLPFDQMINEYNFAWVHVSFGPRNRRQTLVVT